MGEQKKLPADTPLQVHVVTPRGSLVGEATDALTAPGEMGQFEVLPGHVPFVTALHPGVLVLGETRGRRRVFAVASGYLRVNPSGEVEVVVEQGVAGGKVEVETAQKELEAAELALAERTDTQDAEWQNLTARAAWARAQLAAHAAAD